MKVLFFAQLILGALVMLSISSCNKLNEVYEDLDQNGYGDYLRTNMTITLTDDDYTALGSGAPSYIATGSYFLSVEEAQTYIPTILNTNYAIYGNGSSATITFNLHTDIEGEVAVYTEHTVTEDEYDEAGFSYGNFETEDDIINYLTDVYAPNNPTYAVQNSLVILTYEWYNGATRTETGAFYLTSAGWTSTYLVSQADYESTDNGGYSNFDGNDDANLQYFFDSFLKNQLTINPNTGDIQYVTYLYYGDGENYQVTPMQYDGVNWVVLEDNDGSYFYDTTSSLNYAKNNGIWEINAAILYTINAADYAWIADNEDLGTETARGNLGSYSNFYVSDFYWSQEGINAAIAALLAERFPDAAADQIYEVSYDIYTGVTSTTSGRFIADGAGNFVPEVVE